MAENWELHPHLKRDCHLLAEDEQVTTLLHRNACLPWFILVPHSSEEDLLLLDEAMHKLLMQRARHIASYIRDELHYPKINTASIGNKVPQLHLHIVGRKPDDLCWPNPVWGHLNCSKAYDSEDVKTHQVGLDIKHRLTTSLDTQQLQSSSMTHRTGDIHESHHFITADV